MRGIDMREKRVGRWLYTLCIVQVGVGVAGERFVG